MPRRPVVGFSRLELGIEATKLYRSSVSANPRSPAFSVAVPPNTLILGTVGSIPAFRSIAVVLRDRRGAQIGLTIVQTVTINMIYEQMIGNLEHLAMHQDLALF